MTAAKESQAIEMEVLEIDGVVPAVKAERPPEGARPPWEKWQGRLRKLDRRWWPLWVLLGMVLLFLALTVGVVFGIVFVILRAVQGFFRMLLR